VKRPIAEALAIALAVAAGMPAAAYAQSYVPSNGSIIANKVIRVSPSISIALEKIVYWGVLGGIAYAVLDPLAPTWEIEEAPLGDEHIHFSLQMKRYYSGGAGEARALFNRRARELMRLNDFDEYRVVEYSESLEASLFGSRRKAEGVIQLQHKQKSAATQLPPA